MPERQVEVETTAALVAALAEGVDVVRVATSLADVPALALRPGQALL